MWADKPFMCAVIAAVWDIEAKIWAFAASVRVSVSTKQKTIACMWNVADDVMWAILVVIQDVAAPVQVFAPSMGANEVTAQSLVDSNYDSKPSRRKKKTRTQSKTKKKCTKK